MNHNKYVLEQTEFKLITMPQEPLNRVTLVVAKAITTLIYISLENGPELRTWLSQIPQPQVEQEKSKSNSDWNRHSSSQDTRLDKQMYEGHHAMGTQLAKED